MSTYFLNQGIPPGPQAAVETAENTFSWGPGTQLQFDYGVLIDGAARDGGNTGLTTQLRPGLLMGKVTSTGKYKQYDPTATDGTEQPFGILASQGLKVIDLNGANRDVMGMLCIGGKVKNGALFSGLSPYTLDQYARAQLHPRFIFDDDFSGNWTYPYKREIAKTADYTVTAADNGTLFTNLGAVGAVTFTLPTRARGLNFGFMAIADQTITVASAGSLDDIVTFNDAAADSIAFSTGGSKIGAHVRLYCNPAETLWYMELLCKNTLTVV